MTLLFLVLVVVAVAISVGAALIARRGAREFELANEVVPGISPRAPASWAGDHSPEARLHRRLRDAVAALPRDDMDVLEARLAIEQLALAVDEQLVTVAALPDRVRDDPLAQVAAAVEAVEDSVAKVAANELGQGAASGVEDALARLNERVELLAEARRELE